MFPPRSETSSVVRSSCEMNLLTKLISSAVQLRRDFAFLARWRGLEIRAGLQYGTWRQPPRKSDVQACYNLKEMRVRPTTYPSTDRGTYLTASKYCSSANKSLQNLFYSILFSFRTMPRVKLEICESRRRGEREAAALP